MARRTLRQWAVYYLAYLALIALPLVAIILWIIPHSFLAACLIEAAAIVGALAGADRIEKRFRRG